MKTYTMTICSSFGKLNKIIESNHLDELKRQARQEFFGYFDRLEEGEDLWARVYYTSDLESRIYTVPYIWQAAISLDHPSAEDRKKAPQR